MSPHRKEAVALRGSDGTPASSVFLPVATTRGPRPDGRQPKVGVAGGPDQCQPTSR